MSAGLRRLALAVALLLTLRGSAAAQLVPLGPAFPLSADAQPIAPGIAYDPIHEVYLVVTLEGLDVRGIFVNRMGQPVSASFVILTHTGTRTAAGGSIRTAYGPQLDNGSGGRGAFLVAWDASV